MKRAWCTLAAVGVLAAGCAAPDLKRGKAQLEAGDFAAAEEDLKPLADLGYEEAKMQLARVYARRTDPASHQQAIQLYRELLEDNPEVAVPLARTLLNEGNAQALAQAEDILVKADAAGDPLAVMPLLELYSDHPELDRKRRAPKLAERVAKIETPEAEAAVIKWYRRNAATDPKFAQRLVKLCEPAKERLPECYVDLGRHYRAVGDGKRQQALQASAVRQMDAGSLPDTVIERYGRSLVTEDLPGKPWPEGAYPLLKHAAEYSTVAAIRVARLLLDYPHLDPKAQPEKVLLKAGAEGHPEAALALGRMYLDGKLVPPDAAKAEKYLRTASQTEPTAHYHLGRLYSRGFLGKPDAVRGAQHYLTAARAGYARADQALALLFSENRGVKPNLANAFVFASLAADAKLPESKSILQQIRSSMKAGQLEEARQLLKQEIAVRQSLPRPAPAQAPDHASRSDEEPTPAQMSRAETSP